MKTKIYLFILTLLISVGQAWAELPSLEFVKGTVASGTILVTTETSINWKVENVGSSISLHLEGNGALPTNMTTPPWANCTASIVVNHQTETRNNIDLRAFIKSLHIGSGITSVNNTVLGGLTKLESITSSSSKCPVIDGALYHVNGFTTADDPDTYTYALVNYPAKKSGSEVVLGKNVIQIDVNAFNGNKNLQSIYIKGNIIGIGAGAFNNCSNLSLIHFDTDYASSYSWSGMASTGKLITAPRSGVSQTALIQAPAGWKNDSHYAVGLLDHGYAVRNIEGLYIYGPQGTTYKVATSGTAQPSDFPWYSASSYIKKITIGKGITDIDEAALSGGYSNLQTITVEDGNTTYTVENNALCKGNTLVVYAQASAATKFAVPESITTIGAGAFRSAKNLAEVDFLGNVSALGDYAFYYCTRLSRFRFHTNTVSPTIGDLALMHVANNGILSYSVNGQFSDMLSTLNNTTIGGGGIWTRGYFGTESNGNTWSLEDGVLTVNGTGSISSNSGWEALKNQITTVVIGEGIPEIGSSAFLSYPSLSSLILNGGGEIGYHAFCDCSALESITIGKNVSSFYYYKNQFNDAIISTSFDGCDNIKQVNLLDLEAWCNIEHNDVLFDEEKEYTLLCDGVVQKTNEPLTIPVSVTNVHNSFKYFSNVQTIQLPEGRESVANSEFEGYKHLRVIALPQSLKYIGSDAFARCINLVNVGIPYKVEKIGSSAFSGCTSLLSLILNGGGEIGYHAFCDCSALESITIGKNVSSFYYYKNQFNDAIISTSFDGCDNIKKVNLLDLEAWCNIEHNDVLFDEGKNYTLLCNGVEQGTNVSLVIPVSVTNVRESFKYFSNVQTIEIPEGRESVANAEFEGYKHLRVIALPQSLKYIGSDAFARCINLVNVGIPYKVEKIGSSAFSGCTSLSSLILNGGGEIGYHAFCDCSALESITIGKNVSSFYYYKNQFNDAIISTSFDGCDNIKKVNLLDLEAWCNIEHNDVLFDEGKNYTLLCDGVEQGINVPLTIPVSVTNVRESFKYFSNVQTIQLPEGRERIANSEFEGYKHLRVISLPQSLKHIETNAFRRCINLVSVGIPSDVEKIGSFAFSGCTSLLSLILNGGGEIEYRAFCDCSALESITIGKNVSSFNYETNKFNGDIYTSFDGCDNIKKVRIKDLMAYCKIQNIRALTEAGIPNKQLLIGEGTNVPITSLEIPAGVTDIEPYAFYNLGGTTLQEIKLPPTLQRINEYAFGGAPIQTVYSYVPKHPNASNKSIDHPEEATLYVPTGSKTDYEGSSPWKYFKNIVEIDVDFPQLNTNYIEARAGDAPVPLTMPGHTITNVISSNPDVAEWKNGKVVTHASYYNGQGRYTRNNGALLTVIGENNSLVAYCSVKVIPQAQLTDGQAYTNPNDEMMESVVYTRTFKDTQANKWQALCIPFSIDVVSEDYQISEIFGFYPVRDSNGDGIVNGEDEENLIVTPCTSGQTVPNVPYMIKPKKSGDIVFTAENCTLYAANEGELNFSTTRKAYTIHGLLKKSVDATVENQYYYMSSGALNNRTEGQTTVNPNRWYMTIANKSYGGGVIEDSSNANLAVIRVIAIGEDIDEETAIRLIEGDAIGTTANTSDNAIYTINGIMVSDANNLPAGMYIKNGKKFIIK